ncbi:MAG: DUF456 domain-containing protein [Haloarculaceae archaeon]
MTLLDLLVVALALVLLVGGVVGSVTPMLPGGLLSMAGVALYWWHTGFADPHPIVAVGLLPVGATAVAVDWLAGVVSAKAGGARTSTTLFAALVGFLLLLLFGPLGLLAGTVGTVFVVEYYHDRDARGDARAAVVTAVGILASNVVQAVLTGGVLVAMIAAILV